VKPAPAAQENPQPGGPRERSRIPRGYLPGSEAAGPVLFLLVAVLFLTLPGRGALAFEDFGAADPNFPFVKYLADRGVVRGYPDGTFRPLAKVARAETAALLARALGLDAGPAPAAPTFSDLGPDHWAYPVVEAAVRAGVFRGFPDGTFRPEEPVTRAQAAALLLRLTRASTPAGSLPALEDLPPGHWAAPAVAQALDAGLIHLVATGRFAPEAPATRLVLARGLATMLALRPESGQVPLEGTLVPVTGTVWLQAAGGASTAVTGPVTVTAGHRVCTGRDARAEVRFADGSGLRLDPETEIYIKEATGRATILRDGGAGAVADRLVLELPRGRIFGALAARYFYHAAASPATPTGSAFTDGLLAAARWLLPGVTLAQEPSEELPWWKTAFEEKIRVEVDMPWGVAGIRGTFWINEVTATRQSTSVLDGRAEVSAAGRTVTVEPGQSAALTAPTAAPTSPAPMTAEERQAWTGAREWVEQRAAEIQEKAPVVTPPPPVTEQVPPAGERPAEVPPPPPPAPPVVQKVTAALDQTTGGTAPPAAPRTGGGGATPRSGPAVTSLSTEIVTAEVTRDFQVTARLTSDGQAVANRLVSFAIDTDGDGNYNEPGDEPVLEGRTGLDGHVTVTFRNNFLPGDYSFKAKFGGDADYGASEASGRLHVTVSGPAVLMEPSCRPIGSDNSVEFVLVAYGIDKGQYPAGLYAADVILAAETQGLWASVAVEPVPGGLTNPLILMPERGRVEGQEVRIVVSRSGPPDPPLFDRVPIARVRVVLASEPADEEWLQLANVRLATVERGVTGFITRFIARPDGEVSGGWLLLRPRT